MHYIAAAVVLIVLGIGCLATSCSDTTPSRDRVLFLSVGAVLVLLAIGIAGIEFAKGGLT